MGHSSPFGNRQFSCLCSCLGGSATTALIISSHWWVPDLALSPQTLSFYPALASGNSLNYTFFSPPPQLLHPGLGEGRGEQKEGIRGGKLNEKHCGPSCWLYHNCSLQHEFSKALARGVFYWGCSLGLDFGASPTSVPFFPAQRGL